MIEFGMLMLGRVAQPAGCKAVSHPVAGVFLGIPDRDRAVIVLDPHDGNRQNSSIPWGL